jgi:hypothetical protein
MLERNDHYVAWLYAVGLKQSGIAPRVQVKLAVAEMFSAAIRFEKDQSIALGMLADSRLQRCDQ